MQLMQIKNITKVITLAVFLDLIGDISNKRFSSYLSNRKQYIETNDWESPLNRFTKGVPQEFILSPVRFLIMTRHIRSL